MYIEASLRRRTLVHWLIVFISGVCMGAADIVPGISGGTVAFIIGIYPELLESLSSLNARSLKLLTSCRFAEFGKAVKWKFLLVIVCGISFSFLTLAQVFSNMLGDETQRVFLYSTFFGLILASVWFCARLLSEWRIHYCIVFCLGSLAAYSLTGTHPPIQKEVSVYNVQIDLKHQEHDAVNYRNKTLLNVPEITLSAMLAKGSITQDSIIEDVKSGKKGMLKDFSIDKIEPGLDLWLAFCGAIAISAMLLPGISGSYLLAVLGTYSTIIAELTDFTQGLKNGIFVADAFFALASMAIGIVVGAFLFSRIVSWMLYNYYSETIAALTGFMVGAMGSVWPFWSYQYAFLPLKLEKGPQLSVVEAVMPNWATALPYQALVFVAVGFALVFVLERVAQRMRTTTKSCMAP